MRPGPGPILARGALALLLAAAPARADTLQASFGVRLYGAPVGQMVLAANANGAAYAAKGEFRTTGLAGLLARVRFTMSASGVGAPLALSPRSYREDLDTGYRTSAVSLGFAPGDGRIDPLTGLVAALIDRDAATGCAYEGRTFDGLRSMRLRIREAGRDADGITCAGSLTRLSGYTEAEMAEATGFAFAVRFALRGGVLVAERAEVDTIHGKVALVRR